MASVSYGDILGLGQLEKICSALINEECYSFSHIDDYKIREWAFTMPKDNVVHIR